MLLSIILSYQQLLLSFNKYNISHNDNNNINDNGMRVNYW